MLIISVAIIITISILIMAAAADLWILFPPIQGGISLDVVQFLVDAIV